MNSLRILLNICLALVLVWGGIYLLGQETYHLHERWHRGPGTDFSGMSLRLLALSLFSFAAFAAAVARAWIKGIIPMPDPHEPRPHPTYKGQIIVRYWYFVVPGFLLMLSAFILAN